MDPAASLNVMKSGFNVKDLLDLPSEPKPLNPVAVTIGVNNHYTGSDVTPNGGQVMTVTQLENAAAITSSPLIPLSDNNNVTSQHQSHHQPPQHHVTQDSQQQHVTSPESQQPHALQPLTHVDHSSHSADYSNMLSSMGSFAAHNAMFSPSPALPPMCSAMSAPYSQFSLGMTPSSTSLHGLDTDNPYSRWLHTNGSNPYPSKYKLLMLSFDCCCFSKFEIFQIVEFLVRSKHSYCLCLLRLY